MESEWRQVSSSLQDSSQYSGRSKQWGNLDGLYKYSYIKVLQSLQKSFDDSTERTSYN